MLDRPMTIERLLAHSIIFNKASRLHATERRVQAALGMASDVKLDA
jgi:hypothetical protein